MKKTLVISFVILLALLVTSVALAAKKKGFDGAWETIDRDGSYAVMIINTGGPYFMIHDFGSSSCDPGTTPPVISDSFEGTPFIVGNELTVEGKILCVSDDPYYWPEGNPRVFTFVLTYNKNSDTVELFGQTWSRIKK